MIKRIHINQHKIRSNKKNGINLPVITVKTSKSNKYAHRVLIQGESEVIYSETPLKCGARCWIETKSPVVLATTKKKIVNGKEYNPWFMERIE